MRHEASGKHQASKLQAPKKLQTSSGGNWTHAPAITPSLPRSGGEGRGEEALSERILFLMNSLFTNLDADRIAPSPRPSPPMGAREKISQVMRFMGSKREGFIRRILSQRCAVRRGSQLRRTCQVATFLLISTVLSLSRNCHASEISARELFTRGSQAYADGNFEKAAARFLESATAAPASGTWHNVGDAEWQLGRTGPAVLAWERALWLNPYNTNAHSNLRFARKAKLLDAPELRWSEICSTWLPVNAWPWIAMLSLWLAVAMVILPGVFGRRKAGWHQALAAAGFAIFLLTIPALIGIHSRARIAVVLERNTNLRLTPTADAQATAHLAAGETVRLERRRGNYFFVRAETGTGWIHRTQVALIAD
jgi:Bacterial SH3 domain